VKQLKLAVVLLYKKLTDNIYNPMDNRIVQTPLYNPGLYVRDNEQYGDISQSQIMSKFEETEYPEDENGYYEYSRRQASDFRPDQNTFEYEFPRGAVDRSYGIIALRENGTRSMGVVDRPDLFLGIGNDDHDPRGVATIPDFSGLRAQEQFRTKYIRFSKENINSVTGGGVSESGMIEAKKQTNIWKRDNLKVFSRQLDGRQEGMKRQQACESNVNKVELTSDYNDKIKSDALNPTSPTKTISRKSKNEGKWRTAIGDQDIDLIIYANQTRKGINPKQERKLQTATGSTEQHFTASDNTQTKKAAANTMKQITQLAQKSDSEFNNMSVECKNQLQKKKTDMQRILGAQKSDGYFHRSDYAVTYRTPTPQQQNSQVIFMNPDQEIVDINKLIITKSVQEGNIRKAQREVIQSTDFAKEDLTKTQKQAIKSIKSGTKLNVDGTMRELSEHMETANYRHSQNKNKGLRNSEYCALAEGDWNFQRKNVAKVGRFVTDGVDTSTTQFYDNQEFKRRELNIGAKYTSPYLMGHEHNGSITSELQALS
jgi:hypothetical protein